GLGSGVAWTTQLHQSGIESACGAWTKFAIQCSHHTIRHAEVGRVQLKVDEPIVGKCGRNSPLDNRSVGYDSAIELIYLHAGTPGLCAGTAHQQVALRQGVDLTIRTLKRSQQQGAPTKALRIAHRTHHHIHCLARTCKGRQSASPHDSGHVSDLHIGTLGHRDTQLRKHVCEALLSKGRLTHLITASIQTHDQTVSDQLVGAYTLNRGQVLDAVCPGRRHRQEAGQETQAAKQCSCPVKSSGKEVESTRHSRPQKGEIFRKNRCNQPMVCTSSMRPLLRNSIRASATWVEDTVLEPEIERGSTTPEKRICSLPRLMAICFSPAICKLPLGSTPITVVVRVPLNILSARLEPVPSAALPPPISKPCCGPRPGGKNDGTRSEERRVGHECE